MEIEVSKSEKGLLLALRDEYKFGEVVKIHPAFDHPIVEYTGAPDPETRDRCNGGFNELIDELLKQSATGSIKKTDVLIVFSEKLNFFNDEDTEEKEQATGYCETIMDMLNIESSDGTLNEWLYGFDVGL